MRNVLSILLVLVVTAGVFSAWLYLHQPNLIFFPLADHSASPRDWGLDYEDVTLKTDDGVQLHGWFIPHPQAKGTVLVFHGNAGNISHRGETISIFHRLRLNVFIFDYRGYGDSSGKPDEPGLYRDAREAWDFLTVEKMIPAEKIILFGRSLGGAVAAKLATEIKPAGLILESTFSSARDMAHAVFPLISRLTPLRYEFNTEDYVTRIEVPLLVVHSPDDEIIPYALGEKIYHAARKPKTLLKIRGDHNSGFLFNQAQYSKDLGEFISTQLVNKGTVTPSK